MDEELKYDIKAFTLNGQKINTNFDEIPSFQWDKNFENNYDLHWQDYPQYSGYAIAMDYNKENYATILKLFGKSKKHIKTALMVKFGRKKDRKKIKPKIKIGIDFALKKIIQVIYS